MLSLLFFWDFAVISYYIGKLYPRLTVTLKFVRELDELSREVNVFIAEFLAAGNKAAHRLPNDQTLTSLLRIFLTESRPIMSD